MLDEIKALSQQLLRIYQRPYERYFLQTHALTHRLSIVTGAKGVGKSTLLTQYLAKHHSATSLYVPCDHFVVNKYPLYNIIEQFVQNGGTLLCLDEIHQYPEWSMILKSAYDTFPKLQILASGSSALAISQGSHDLSRRAIKYTLHGMSFREYLELTLGISMTTVPLSIVIKQHDTVAQEIMTLLAAHECHILPLFHEYLRYGYYPYYQELADIDLFYTTLEQNLHTTIERDLPAVYPNLTGISIRKIRKLLTIIASHVPFTPDLKALKSLIEVSDERTLKSYLKYLTDASLIIQLPKAGKAFASLDKPEKIYLQNTNQLYALSGLQQANTGTVREVFFANMMLATGHVIQMAQQGDFIIDNQWTFEIGGKNKDHHQIQSLPNAYLALDNLEAGFGRQIPLWLFGLLY